MYFKRTLQSGLNRNCMRLFQSRLSNLIIESDKENAQLTSIISERSLNNLKASGG